MQKRANFVGLNFRKILKNAPNLAFRGADIAENEPSKVLSFLKIGVPEWKLLGAYVLGWLLRSRAEEAPRHERGEPLEHHPQTLWSSSAGAVDLWAF